ncbi:hypothetical protein Bca101_035659 [Brassica carinata]
MLFAGEIRLGDGEGDDLVHVSEDDEETRGGDGDGGDGEGKEGKLRKERETRDGERALRDVEEMERSEEEFVKEMEVTRTQSSYYKKSTTHTHAEKARTSVMPEQRINEKALTKDANGPTYQNPYSFYNLSLCLVLLQVEAEEKRTNLRLREEQNAAYRASLEADQARESQRQEEEERLEREAAEAERKRKEEEEAQERAEREAVERETDRVRMRPEKVLALGDDPEKVPDVAHVLVRFPNGERKGRRLLAYFS